MESQALTPDRAICKIVEMHYNESEEPLLLSTIGVELSRIKVNIPGDGPGRLKRYIEDHLSRDLAIVRHRSIDARVAVCPVAKIQDIDKAINAGSYDIYNTDAGSHDSDTDLGSYQRAVLFAFCGRLPAGTQVFLNLKRPIRFVTDPEEARALDCVEVDRDLRLPSVTIPKDGPPLGEYAEKLKLNIKTWAKRHEIDLSALTAIKASSYKVNYDANAHESLENALYRLIQAQPSNLRSKFLIPLDVAELLMRHR